jgi:UDP-N-acetylmuramyl pentapeptide synthase
MQNIFIKKYFLFTVGSVSRIAVHNLVEKRGKRFADDEEAAEVALRQQSNDSGFVLVSERNNAGLKKVTSFV